MAVIGSEDRVGFRRGGGGLKLPLQIREIIKFASYLINIKYSPVVLCKLAN